MTGADSEPAEAHERQRAIDLARSWAPSADPATVEAVVDTAYVAARSGLDVDRLARDVSVTLAPEDRLRLISDLGRIAQADGRLTVQEARTIASIRAAFARPARWCPTRLAA